jgi:hypothetical protein
MLRGLADAVGAVALCAFRIKGAKSAKPIPVSLQTDRDGKQPVRSHKDLFVIQLIYLKPPNTHFVYGVAKLIRKQK